MNVIKIEKLNYYYNKKSPFEKQALKNVSLEINENEFIGIVGHTGSGKSTLMKMFNGLNKPDSGVVYYKGQDIWGKKFNQRNLRFDVGVSFQYPEHQLFCDTVKKDIEYGLVNKGVKEEDFDQKVKQVLEIVGLDETYLEKSPFELSGGEMRKVAIAGTMVLEPEVLVLDEPTAGLDPQSTKRIYQFLKRYQSERGNTVIVVSHSMEDVAEYATQLIAMSDGEIKLSGKVADVFKEEAILKSIGLNIPITTHLLKTLSEKLPGVNPDLYTYDETKQEIIQLLKGVKKHE